MASARKHKKATIFDVAALAGVSIKTVSRVVNNEPNVQEKTREKVQQAVDKLQYQPNSAARTLSGNKSFVIGLVYENPQEFSYMKEVLAGALKACEEEGYTLLLHPINLPDPRVAETIRQFAVQTRIDGIVLPAPLGDELFVRELLIELNLPTALISPKQDLAGAISVLVNDEEAIYGVTEHLIAEGHRRIGFIKGHPDHGATEKRLEGYRRALRDHEFDYDESLVQPGLFDFESGQKAAERLLAQDQRPTAIIASNDDMAIGVLFEAHRRKLEVPEELSVIGFDDTAIAQRIWPALSTVRQPIQEMTQSVTKLLIRSLRGEDVHSPENLFDCEFIIRSSSGGVN